MPSSNPRYGNWKARQAALREVRRRAANGEPCGICGGPIDLDAPQWVEANGRRRRSPWALDCDEVIPVSRGGSPYDFGNIQPAHHACNLRKGNKSPRASQGAAKSFSMAARGSTSREW